jgi:hypothetical protein
VPGYSIAKNHSGAQKCETPADKRLALPQIEIFLELGADVAVDFHADANFFNFRGGPSHVPNSSQFPINPIVCSMCI